MSTTLPSSSSIAKREDVRVEWLCVCVCVLRLCWATITMHLQPLSGAVAGESLPFASCPNNTPAAQRCGWPVRAGRCCGADLGWEHLWAGSSL